MEPSRNEVEKLNLSGIFENDFNNNQIFSVGKDERIELKITCPKFDQIDKYILCIILKDGEKKLGNDRVTCRIEAIDLIKRLEITEVDLYGRLRRYVSFSLEVRSEYIYAHYNFIDLGIFTENKKRDAYELGIYNLATFCKYFHNKYIDYLIEE